MASQKIRTRYELAQAVNLFAGELLAKTKLSSLQIKVLGKIAQCRTAALGGHEEVCLSCGTVRYSYNSCGDRHCPKCQSLKQALWVDELLQSTLPTKHFHIVFTVPHVLNAVCLHDQRMYYDILFASVWSTLRSFGYTHYGCETGAVCVLHTWGQNLSLHPHLHCIVPAAGYTLHGKWKHIGHGGRYLYPVQQLCNAFKHKFLDSLKRALRKQNTLAGFNHLIQKAYTLRWVINLEPSLANATHVVKYLGQYTHRVAITNERILNIADGKITFITKDYRDGAIQKPVTMQGVEFLRRFTTHIMPRRFVRIRRFGIYHPTLKRNLNLKFTMAQKSDIETLARKYRPPETNLERFVRITGFDPRRCPACKTGCMVRIRELPRIRSPNGWITLSAGLQLS